MVYRLLFRSSGSYNNRRFDNVHVVSKQNLKMVTFWTSTGDVCTYRIEMINYHCGLILDERDILIILDNSLDMLSKIITYIFASCDQHCAYC